MILRATWVLPVGSPPIRGGAVRVEGGHIAAMGTVSESAGEPVVDLGKCALLPGFVNAHTHLELTGYAGRLPAGPLWNWLGGLIALRREPGAAEAEVLAAARGAELSLHAGVTCVGDISRTGRAFEALLESPIRKICFHELISGAGEPPSDPDELREALLAFRARVGGREDVFAGVSPHSPYTVSWDDLRRVAALAAEQDVAITMHWCETREEREWLESRGGPLGVFLSHHPVLGAMRMPQGPPLSVLHRVGMTRLRPLLAHANYVTDDEIADLARAGCSVAYCPRAHRFFGHEGHPWREMLAAGVNVCAATDSLASNESLSVLDELRFLRRAAPEVSAATLLEMGTIRGARALGLEDSVGALRPGMWADMVAIPLDGGGGDDPIAAILDGDRTPSRVWVGGVEIQLDR